MKLQSIEIPIIVLSTMTISYLLIWFIIKTPLINLFRDKPGLRKVHQRIIPRIGGVAILSGFIVSIFTWQYLFPSSPRLPSSLLAAITFASFAIMIVGLADDMIIFQIHNKGKFILELLIAAEIVFLNNIKLDNIHFVNYDFSLGWWGVPVTILWIVGVTNAINIIDGVDGLAGSIIFVIFSTIAVLTGFSSGSSILILCLIMMGLVGGFLMHNISPARVFLGDTGSLFLGIIIGVLSIYLISNPEIKYPVAVAPLIVGLPILDVFVAMGRRFTKRILSGGSLLSALRAMTVADNEHIHHRLIYRGLTHTETVIILLIFHSVICMSAIVINFTNNYYSFAMLLYISFVGSWFLYKLHFFDRFIKLLKLRNASAIFKKLDITVVNSSEILRYSLTKYAQNLFKFTFYSELELQEKPVYFGAATIIEQNKNSSIEETVALASTIFLQHSCPVLVISTDNEPIPEHLIFSGLGTYLLVKHPVYTPVLFKDLIRLIRLRRSRLMDKVTKDTKQFFMQAIIHEEI